MRDISIKISYSEKYRKFDDWRHSDARASVKFGKVFNSVDVIFDDYVNAPDEHIYDTGVLIRVTKGVVREVQAEYFVRDKKPFHKRGSFLNRIEDLSDKDIAKISLKDSRIAIIVEQAKRLIVENLIFQDKEKVSKRGNYKMFQKERD